MFVFLLTRSGCTHQAHANRNDIFLVMDKHFDQGVAVFIVLNMLVLATRHYNQDGIFYDLQHYSNIVFVLLYTVEAVLRVIGVGIVPYLRYVWRRIDLLFLLLGWIDVFYSATVSLESMFFICTRIFRCMRLICFNRQLSMILTQLLKALPSLSNIAGLMALLFFVLAVLGMDLYGRIPLRRVEVNDALNGVLSVGLSEHTGMNTFPLAVQTLFRIMTSDSWTEVMHGLGYSHKACAEADSYSRYQGLFVLPGATVIHISSDACC